MKSKGFKTNIVSYVAGIVGIVIVGFYLAGELSDQKFTLAVATLGTLTAMVGSKLAKDQDGTHTEK